eukprot:m.57243 g.57243  ORF g.57243 m.57243 type:complete len:196 (-) comp13444_c0_seq2:175-762(-)
MDKHLFNLKMAAKQLDRLSKKCDKDEKSEKAKLKKAIEKGNNDGARIHAENAIRQRNQSLNFLRMSARVDAVAQRVQTAVTMKKVTSSMKGVVQAMDKALSSMDLMKLGGLMDQFEHQFENLDIQVQVMDSAISQSTTLNTPEGQVDALMKEVADEHGLELNMELGQHVVPSPIAAASKAETDDLNERLAKLREG